MASDSFYFDEMLSRPAAQQLEKRGLSVVMAIDVDMTGKTDPEHIAYATERKLIMVTFDRPFASITMGNTGHAGLICLSSIRQDNTGGIVKLLTDFAELYSDEDVTGQVFWL
jgi:predicted nuclease of predicted toxin-antitoxin system